ncbi:MAG: thermonuclease family protein [Bacteroidetes bacterium]|nr:thermonuclease family protein [Bacteroidota bacterium]
MNEILSKQDLVRVTEVVDGDTFHAEFEDGTNKKVRLLAVDTPELQKNESFAGEAATFVKELIDGKTVRLTYEEKRFDIYGRVLAYVWLLDEKGNDLLIVQAELLKKGYARLKDYPKQMMFYDVFRNLKFSARRKKIGIWKR